jgi:hypothetical protein
MIAARGSARSTSRRTCTRLAHSPALARTRPHSHALARTRPHLPDCTRTRTRTRTVSCAHLSISHLGVLAAHVRRTATLPPALHATAAQATGCPIRYDTIRFTTLLLRSDWLAAHLSLSTFLSFALLPLLVGVWC